MKREKALGFAARFPIPLVLAACLLLVGCVPMKPPRTSFSDRVFRYQDQHGGFSVILPDQLQIIPTSAMGLDPLEVPLLAVSNHPWQFYGFGFAKKPLGTGREGFAKIADRFESRLEESIEAVKSSFGIHNLRFLNYRRTDFQGQPALYFELSGTEVINHLSMPTHGSGMFFLRGNSGFCLAYMVVGDTLEEAEQLFRDMAAEREKTYNSFTPLDALQ